MPERRFPLNYGAWHPAYAHQPGYGAPAASAYAPAEALTRRHSKLAEWYLTVCMLIPLIEAKFSPLVEYLVTSRTLFIFRLTPYNLPPTDLYFLSVGFGIGLLILLMGRRDERVPIRGFMLYFFYWCALGCGVLVGLVQGSIGWLGDFRNLLLPSIVLPWLVVLVEHVRIQVVLNRMIRIAAVLAALHAFGGGLYFVRGGYMPENSPLAADWRGCYVLLFYYCLAFARTVGSDQKTPLSLICLALGMIVPLFKPVLATFFATNIILLALAMHTGRRFGNVKIGGILLTLALVVGIGFAGMSVAFSLGQGLGKEKLLNKIFKYKASYSERDVTGGRLGIWTGALEDFASNPVFGTGLGGRIVHVVEGKIIVVPIHNLYVQLLSQTGLVGFVTLSCVAIVWLLRSYGTLSWEPTRDRYWPRLGALSFILGILFSAGYGDSFAPRPIAYSFWIAVALETWSHCRTLSEQGR